MIEQIARSSAEELRTVTGGDVDAGLADLHVRHAQHRRRTAAAGVVAVVVALGVGWSAGSVLTRSGAEDSPGPAHHGPSAGAGRPEICTSPRVKCLGDRTYRFGLDRPVVWTVPPGFAAPNDGAFTSLVDAQIERQFGRTAGVTVLEHVRAPKPSGSAPASGVPDDPRAFIDWVASRPFLEAGKVVRTTLDGHEAWRVRVALAPGVGPGPSTCTGSPCYAITTQHDYAPTGIWDDMVAQYVAFRLPGGGTTVVWSWLFGGTVDHLGELEVAAHGVSFPGD
jgi:hypothetical protein